MNGFPSTVSLVTVVNPTTFRLTVSDTSALAASLGYEPPPHAFGGANGVGLLRPFPLQAIPVV